MKQEGAEFLGTFWLVLGGCGSAVIAAAFPNVGIGLLGVALAFGLTVLTMAFAIGHISGCHLNPAVSVGLWAGGRFPANKLVPYIVAQVLGAIVAGGVLYVIASGAAGFDVSKGFASNGYGCTFAWRLFSFGGSGQRSGHDYVFSVDYTRRNRQACTSGLCSHRDRPRADADSPDQHSSDQYFGQSCAKHGRCRVCRRLGYSPTLALLGCSHRGRFARSGDLSLHCRRGRLMA